MSRPHQEAFVIVSHAALGNKKPDLAVSNSGPSTVSVPELAKRAQHRGVETFTGEVLGENRCVLGQLDAVFVEVNHLMKDGVYHVRVPLRTPEESGRAGSRRTELSSGRKTRPLSRCSMWSTATPGGEPAR